jgi:hypothetical protein
VLSLRLATLAVAAAVLLGCAAPGPDERYGDFQPTAWQLVGSVTPAASQLVIDVRSPGCGLANPYVRTQVTYGSDNITIFASVSEQKACSLILAFAADVRCVVQLKEPLGNRQLIGPFRSPKPPGPDPNETAGPSDTTERPLPPGHPTPVPMTPLPVRDGSCVAG